MEIPHSNVPPKQLLQLHLMGCKGTITQDAVFPLTLLDAFAAFADPKHWRQRNKASPQVNLSQQNHLMAIPTRSVFTWLKMLRVNVLPCSRSSSWLQNNVLLSQKHADQLLSILLITTCFLAKAFAGFTGFLMWYKPEKKKDAAYLSPCVSGLVDEWSWLHFLDEVQK